MVNKEIIKMAHGPYRVQEELYSYVVRSQRFFLDYERYQLSSARILTTQVGKTAKHRKNRIRQPFY